MLYYPYNEYLKKRYGQKVWRLPLDRGVPCPNRLDGKPGCLFCDGVSFLPDYLDASDSIDAQLEKGRAFYQNRLGVTLFIGYFQANTNTYGDPEELRALYESVIAHDYIAELVIATRPDYIDRTIVTMLHALAHKYGKEIWIELGLQSTHDATLSRIQRGHDYQKFREAVALIREQGALLKIGVHMILGLPGETPAMMIESTRLLFRENAIDGIKYRPLDILEGTLIAEDYARHPEEYVRFSDTSFVTLMCDIIEKIPPSVVLMRFANFKSFTNYSTDEATYTKGTLLRKVEDELQRRGTKQGTSYTTRQ